MSCKNEYHFPLPLQCKPDVSVKMKLSVAKTECENRSRFSDRQVKLLETVFETEMKIEPLKKVQLAKELGLEPRQVAIWFQNRRARWKSKQLEKEYMILKGSYETLASQVESLKQEKQSLYAQLQSLSLALRKARESENGNSSSEYGQVEEQPLRFDDMEVSGTINAAQAYLSVDEQGNSSQASTEQEGCGIDACYVFVQPWEFWNF